MTTANLSLKRTARARGVFLYEIADRLGMIDTAFSRKLRRELDEGERQQILEIIDELAAGKGGACTAAD